MLLAGLFVAMLTRARASPVSTAMLDNPISSPLCVAAAVLTASKCDPTARRTIFDILYSSIGVILLCTYASIHHNIPDQKHSWLLVTLLKLRTVLFALLAPELMIMWAMRQRIMAGKIAEENKHRGWTRTHAFFIQMGGLMQRKQREQTPSSTYYQVLMPEQLDRTTLIPYIPEKEIQDHGKGDILAKAIVILHTTWFIIQCIARSIRGLTLTEIELVALAFAVLNAITYGLWWDKPLNVEYPIYFDEEGKRIDGPRPEEMQRDPWYKFSVFGGDLDLRRIVDVMELVGVLITLSVVLLVIPMTIASIMEMAYNGSGDEPLRGDADKPDTSVHPFYAARMKDRDFMLAVAYSSAIGMAFGGIHLFGWNFCFFTPAELWLWRGCSLIITIVPFIVVSFQALGFNYDHVRENSTTSIIFALTRTLLGMPTIIGIVSYVVSRFIILFLAFYTLRSLPDIAYENIKWTDFIPHI
ncbi:hypothetical protein AX16_001155 [Volvariella volvacea WC 439]|nr:hypothetical protein AX16_001155 [Volvariella volvacea WC 439]